MQAPPYQRRKDFTKEIDNATDRVALNEELDNASQSINGLRGNLAKIQRDDEALRDGVVNADTLAAPFKADLKRELERDIQSQVDASRAAAQQAQTAERGAQAAEQKS